MIIEPYVVIGQKVRIGNNVTIKSFSHLENCKVENKVDIGYHLIIEDEFGISESNVNKSKKLAEACIKGGLKNCKLLAE